MNYIFYLKRNAMLFLACASGWFITHGIMRYFELTDPLIITQTNLICFVLRAFVCIVLGTIYNLYFDSLKNKP